MIGITERVADIKTRAQSMKCLSTFCEAVGPGFIFERVIPFSCIFVGLVQQAAWGITQ